MSDWAYWERGKLRGTGYQPDPRPPARVKDPYVLREYRLLRLGDPCDNECGRFGQHVHHKVFRSQGGGDVPENLAWLCGVCHDAAHGIRRVT